MTNRVLLIGIEAAESLMLEKWWEEGKLLNLRKLMSEGLYRRLKSTAHISSGGTWPTLHTGRNPAKHGISYSHRHFKTGTYEIHKQYSDEIKEEVFWESLAKEGKRCAIIDIPKTYPKKNFNGYHIVNWGDENHSWKQESWPPNLIKDVLNTVGKHPLNGWYHQRPVKDEDYNILIDAIKDGIRKRTDMIKFILSKEDWDFVFASYAELHWAGHLLWHTYDKNHPFYKEEIGKKYGNCMYEFYAEIDKGIGEILSVSEAYIPMVFSNLGMGPNYSGRHLVPKVLEKLKLTPQTEPSNPSIFSLSIAKKFGSQSFEYIEKYLPVRLINKAKNIFPEKKWDSFNRKLLFRGNNWGVSQAFAIPSDSSGAIRINLIGREPNGLVRSGEEFDNLCKFISDSFYELTNPSTGRKAVDEVVVLANVFEGEYIDDLPDIIIKWKSEAPINALSSDKIGKVEGTIRDKRSGAHTSNGFVIFSKDGMRPVFNMDEGHVWDIAATVLYLLGAQIPSDMDGKPIEEIMPYL